MTTRFNARPRINHGVLGLPTGYESKTSSDVTIQPVGIEDVDKGVFSLFDSDIPINVTTADGQKKVPCIFASGEKWAMLQKGRALRDKHGSLILPLITIGRTTIQQNPNTDIVGRGINQQTGELVIKRRLSPLDRDYQSLLNKRLIKNQLNIAVNPDDSLEEQITTLRDIDDDNTPLLSADLKKNVWEFITVPSPQFFTAVYQVTIWTSYTSNMNEIIECLMSSFLPQGNAWVIQTDKSYWFVATVEGGLYSSENNFDEMSNEERIIKLKFDINVPAFLFAPRSPGAPIPVKRYVSYPEISFQINDSVTTSEGIDDPFLGADDPTLPLSLNSKRTDGRNVGETRLYSTPSNDPALLTKTRGHDLPKYKEIIVKDKFGKEQKKYARVKSVGSNGETVYSSISDLSDFSINVSRRS